MKPLVLVCALAVSAGVAVAGYAYAGGTRERNEVRAVKEPSARQIGLALSAARQRDEALYRRMVIALKGAGYLPSSTAVPPRRTAGQPPFAVSGPVLGASTQLSDEVKSFVVAAARATGTPVEVATAELRLLRRGVGPGRGDVYFFESPSGVPCFLLTGFGGACRTVTNGTTGFMWALREGEGGEAAVLVGVAADNVRAVRVVAGARASEITISQNVGVAEITEANPQISISVVYDDGSQERIETAIR